MKPHAVTMNFFPDGDDLPLFSGALVAVTVHPFTPAPVARQESLLDMRLDPFHTLEAGADPTPPASKEETPWNLA